MRLFPSFTLFKLHLFSLLLALCCTPHLKADTKGPLPSALYFTWASDPCRSMVINWHVERDSPEPSLFVRKRGDDTWQKKNHQRLPYPFTKQRLALRTELKALEPGSAYEVKFGNNGRVLYFKTMPATLTEPLRIAVGGDTMHTPGWFMKTNLAAMAHNPDFIIWGGDLAYENGEAKNLQKIIDWFDVYTKTCVLADGRVVPAITIPGNHEVRGGYYNGTVGSYLTDSARSADYVESSEFRSRLAPYYFGLFASQPGYGVLDFGDYLSLVLLDTNHTNPIEGIQTTWLTKVLNKRQSVPWLIPVYHVPAYPSVRNFDGEVSALVRSNWLPLFEKAGVRMAFENHDHAYKRTYPILNGKVDPKGITFLGDGAWGVGTRNTHPPEKGWYLERSAPARHFMILSLEPQKSEVRVIDEDGKEIDAVSINRIP